MRIVLLVLIGCFLAATAIAYAVQNRPGQQPAGTVTTSEPVTAVCAAGDEFCGGAGPVETQPAAAPAFTTMKSYDRCVREAERQGAVGRVLCGPPPG